METERQTLLDQFADFIGNWTTTNHPIEPVIDLSDSHKEIVLFFRIRTTSWEFDGDRTDLHDALSILFALFLRVTRGVSSSLWDIGHVASGIPTELSGRILTIEQPHGPVYALDCAGIDSAKEMVWSLTMFQMWLAEYVDRTADRHGGFSGTAASGPAEKWARPIVKCLRITKDSSSVQWMARRNPTWNHFRCVRPFVSVLQMDSPTTWLREQAARHSGSVEVRHGERVLFVSKGSRNSISVRDIRLLRKVLSTCEPEFGKLGDTVLPLENKLVGIGARHIVVLDRDCGRRRFEVDRERLRDKFTTGLAALFPAEQFVWCGRVKDDDFECLVLALLERDPQVHWVRRVGSTHDRDGGRDLLAEWATRPLNDGESLDEEQPNPVIVRRIVVQCKAYSRPVDKSRVTDIRDLVEHYGAGGYFLAVSSSVTSGLFDHLDRLRVSGRLWVDWWTRHEIEERLEAYPDVLAKFSHVVQRRDKLPCS